MSSNVKQVKVDNWGIYFLQRLKNFFNRTDYCDLTLQFQDKAQLKVHRLVLSACTEYFELLERTCEMYEDCLIMPDDLQADVVVPIINFMYTGQLEFSMDILERLYQTSQIMNMPILTKLLNAHRTSSTTKPIQSYAYTPKRYPKRSEKNKMRRPSNSPVAVVNNKRSYNRAFSKDISGDEKDNSKLNKIDITSNDTVYKTSIKNTIPQGNIKKNAQVDPRPTRYELPEELDTDNIFDNSFTNISYTSEPLMVHPETVKRYSKHNNFNQPSTSKKLGKDTTTVDIVHCKKELSESIFEDSPVDMNDVEIFPSYTSSKDTFNNSNQFFDQAMNTNEGPKVTIETKNSKTASNLDHAKIISEVLKRYPHLVKSNKNIKLKILNTPNKVKKDPVLDTSKNAQKPEDGFAYESDVIDSKQAAKLIALGAENVNGPWICLICGTPGKALHFTSYYKFRCHLVEVHKEKPVPNICEYCGLKSLKRNYMLHHLYSQHNVPPPAQYKFPKCNLCNYIALTESFLVKHKMTHTDARRFHCNICSSSFSSTRQLLSHIQATGHKYTPEKKSNFQCIYCFKVFLRDYNLFAHLKTYHKRAAKADNIMEDSDEENSDEKSKTKDQQIQVKYEPTNQQSDYEEVDLQYEIQERPGGSIEIVSKQQASTQNQKILNPGFAVQKPISASNLQQFSNESLKDETEEVVMIDNDEYIVKDNQLIPRQQKPCTKEDYIITDMIDNANDQSLNSIIPTTSMEFINVHNPTVEENPQSQRVIINKQTTINQPIQIVVSNEEEYKALMSSNHPIIFDSNNSNKTLTVLNTPISANLGTSTLSLDNTQPNNMMIIPDAYPLSVTDTVTGNNSNIVVVYSHPVENQKQYQLITSQGLGNQFVQSSAIISHSYETVSSNTPVMSAHVLDTPENWQNTINETIVNQDQIDTNIDDHAITNSDNLNTSENETDLTGLPEVVLSQQISEVPYSLVEESLVQSQAITEVSVPNNEQVIINKNEPEILLESEVPVEIEEIPPIKVSKSDETEKIHIIDENDRNNISDHQAEVNIENIPNTEQVQTETDVEIVIPLKEAEQHLIDSKVTYSDELTVKEHIAQEDQQVNKPVQDISYSESPTFAQEELSNVQQVIADSHSKDVIEMSERTEPFAENATITKPIDKNIVNLTSEWSEDEYDAICQKESDESQINEKTIANNENIAPGSPVKIVESIENIQKAVNELTGCNNFVVEPKEIVNNSIENVSQIVNTNKGDETELMQNSPQNKISSLLNDWEDNDSPEENISVIENSNTEMVEIKKIDNKSESISAQMKNNGNESQPVKQPDDNIRSLVSDWDDDDEESK